MRRFLLGFIAGGIAVGTAAVVFSPEIADWLTAENPTDY